MTLETVKNYLNITWTDTATDTKVTGEINRAESYLNSVRGKAIDFDDETTDKAQLLLDCVRYIHNDAFEDFKNNFREDLDQLRRERQVEDYAAAQNTDV